MSEAQPVEISDRSYAVAVSLCMIFGVLGIHHFYLGNKAHGMFDLGLFIVGFGLIIAASDPMLMMIGGLLIFIDILHTLVVTILLFVGKVRDGEGRVVAWPGQF